MIFLITAALVASRIGAVVMIMPVFNTMGVPKLHRLAVAICLTVVVAPVVPQAEVWTLSSLLLGMIGEILVGVVMGGTVAILFGAITMASEFMGMQIGLRIAAVFDPLSVSQTGLISAMSRWLATLVFLGANLHLWVLEAVGDSFILMPPGQVADPLAAGALWIPTLDHAIHCGVRLAGPVMVLVFMVQAFLGIMVRLAPNMNVFFAVGLIVNVAAGLSLYHEALPVLLMEHLAIVKDSLGLIEQATQLAR
jgi:flagellar biosynthetic protein FliR